MYEIESIEIMRRNMHRLFDDMIEQLAKDDTISFTEFSLKIKNVESLREEIDYSFDSIIMYIYRQMINPSDESFF